MNTPFVDVLSELDTPGSITQGVTDTHTLVVAAGFRLRWLGTIFTCGLATTNDQVFEGRVSGAAQIARGVLAIDTGVPSGMALILKPPDGCGILLGDGQDLSIISIVQASAGGVVAAVNHTTFYTLEKHGRYVT